MFSRRDFLQFGAVAGLAAGMSSGLAGNLTRALARQRLTQKDLLDFDAKGQVTILHLTDIHAQLKPVYYREPDTNIGVGPVKGLPPHLTGEAFLSHFGIAKGTPAAYAFTMVDYLNLARSYGKLGGLDRIATVVKAIRAERGEDKVLLLDGGDSWQGSYTALKSKAQDMVACMKLLKPEAMVGHWEFTLGEERVKEIINEMDYPFLASNVFDTEWDEPVFDSTAFYEKGGHKVAVIGQAMPYTPISNPGWMFPDWSFGIRPHVLQDNVNKARDQGAEVVVLLSHNGFDVDRKLASLVKGIDVILTGHTHDAIPQAITVGKTVLLASGSHGKFIGRIDLEIGKGGITGFSSRLIPIFSDVIAADPEMAAKIAEVRAPYEDECDRVLAKTDSLLYRRGNFNGTWDDVMCDAVIERRDVQVALSPGFRWGTTLLPGENITVDDLYAQTAITYPAVYRQEMTGQQLKSILEDVCDNLFNKDPFLQQGGDMVRVGGMSFTCAPERNIGSRISNMVDLKTGAAIEAGKSYTVGGWASVNQNVEGPAIFDLMKDYFADHHTIAAESRNSVKVSEG